MAKNKQLLANQETGIVARSINGEYQKCSIGCQGPVITDNVSGEIFCGLCGWVLEERSLETIQEPCYDLTDYMTKKSTAPIKSITMFDTNMTTIISDKDGLGNSLSTRTKETFYRLKRLNNRRIGYANNKSLQSSLLLLNTLRMKLGLPDSLTESAAYLYRKAMRDKITVGRNAKNLMCACIYITCKKQGVPRSILEISIISNISKKEITRACRTLVEKMEIPLIPFNPTEFMTRIANEAGISEKSRRDAIDILAMAKREKLVEGKNPKALAAASLYLACMLNNERKSQDELSKASGVTATTIGTRYCELKMNIFEE